TPRSVTKPTRLHAPPSPSVQRFMQASKSPAQSSAGPAWALSGANIRATTTTIQPGTRALLMGASPAPQVVGVSVNLNQRRPHVNTPPHEDPSAEQPLEHLGRRQHPRQPRPRVRPRAHQVQVFNVLALVVRSEIRALQ